LKLPVKIFIILSLIYRLCASNLFAACTATVNTFPYAEDFEFGAGNWVSGGINNDWSLGAPTKSIINAAGSGSNCWIIGGLTTSFYQFGERSWVESPCFDFSSLDFPVVSFQIFWETENQYDGGNFQYSLNGGTSWVNVGTNNEPADCFTQNWFNQSSITNLSSLASVNRGWSGTTLPTNGMCVGGNGSNGWKQAKHCMKNLAHQPQVKFRFTFGAGTTCNDYDGLAFDDFKIEEAQSSVASFTFNCTSSTAIALNDASTNCAETWFWDFNDGNTSSTQSPTHAFSSAGVYNIKLVTGNSCSANDTATQQVTIIEALIASTDETCAGLSDGSATVTVNPVGAYNYSWNTVPVQTTANAINLASGNYTVDISGTDVCSNTASVFIDITPSVFNPGTTAVATSCPGVNDGMAIISAGNNFQYSYSWNTIPVQTTDTAFNLAPGTYDVSVTGPGICTAALFSVVVDEGQNGIPEYFLGDDTSTCTGNPIQLYAGIYSSYLWDDGSDSSYRIVNMPGIYFAQVVTSAGCTGYDSIHVEEKCLDDVVFPNTFTPNNDGLNDVFYAYGMGVVSFYMQMVDRWGEKIYESNSIDEGWDGSYSSHFVHDGIYLCMVKYSMDGVNFKTKKGKVALIR
jgi:gliding motility-associated-like protein